MADLKKPLEHSKLFYIESVTERAWRSNICQECVIEKYSGLKYNTNYSMTHKVQDKARTLKFNKTKSSHSFNLLWGAENTKLLNRINDKMVFHILYEENKPVWLGDLEEINYGYKIEVPNSIVLSPDNKYLHDDNRLVIQFSYRHYHFSRHPIAHCGKVTESDEDAFSDEMLSLYKNSEHADFTIVTPNGEIHHVHKIICSLWSSLIRCLPFKNITDLSVKSESRIVDILLRYMYCGRLDDMSIEDLIKVLDLTNQLCIFSLRQSLIMSLREKLNKDNSQTIANVAEKYGLKQLALYVQEFSGNLFEECKPRQREQVEGRKKGSRKSKERQTKRHAI